MVRMAVHPVGYEYGCGAAAAHELDRAPDLVGPPDLAIRPMEVLAPRDSQHGRARAGLREPVVHRAVAPELAARQVAQTDLVSQPHLFGDGAPDAYLDVVRVRPEGQHIDCHVLLQTTATGWSGAPPNAAELIPRI